MSARHTISRPVSAVSAVPAAPAHRVRPPALDALEPRRLFSGQPAIGIADASVAEGHDGARYAAVVVSLSSRSRNTVSVNFATAAGSATSGVDFAATSGTLTFAPGETQKSIRVPVKGDRLPESDESLFVRLSGARNAKVARAQATLTVLDDEPRVALVNGVVGVTEGNAGTTPVAFDVALSVAYDQPVTVNYATADYTAVAGEDYVAAAGALTFAPGETLKTVTVMVLGDGTAELEEGFFLNLAGASANAMVGGIASGYASVADDDGYYDDLGSYGSDPWSYDPGYSWY
jgi:hypothetical protein